jgi:hypothetical protein
MAHRHKPTPGPGQYQAEVRPHTAPPQVFEPGDDTIGFHRQHPPVCSEESWDWEAVADDPGVHARNKALKGLYSSRTCVAVKAAGGDEAKVARRVQVRGSVVLAVCRSGSGTAKVCAGEGVRCTCVCVRCPSGLLVYAAAPPPRFPCAQPGCAFRANIYPCARCMCGPRTDGAGPRFAPGAGRHAVAAFRSTCLFPAKLLLPFGILHVLAVCIWPSQQPVRAVFRVAFGAFFTPSRRVCAGAPPPPAPPPPPPTIHPCLLPRLQTRGFGSSEKLRVDSSLCSTAAVQAASHGPILAVTPVLRPPSGSMSLGTEKRFGMVDFLRRSGAGPNIVDTPPVGAYSLRPAVPPIVLSKQLVRDGAWRGVALVWWGGS